MAGCGRRIRQLHMAGHPSQSSVARMAAWARQLWDPGKAAAAVVARDPLSRRGFRDGDSDGPAVSSGEPAAESKQELFCRLVRDASAHAPEAGTPAGALLLDAVEAVQLSLHVDNNALPTPTRVCRRHREPSLSPLPTHINAHTLIHVLHTLHLPLSLPPPHDPPYFCAKMNSLSIKNCVNDFFANSTFNCGYKYFRLVQRKRQAN